MPTTRSSAALIRAALELIADTGIDTLTLSQVAAHAGVSRATAYREFGDKDGLLSGVAQHEIGEMIAATFGDVDPHADTPALVSALAVSALRYLRNHAAFTHVRDHEPHWLLYGGLTIGAARMNLVQTVAAIVAPAIPSGDRLALPPLESAEVVVRMVMSHALMESSSLSDAQVAEAVARAVVGA